jgi:integrase
MQDNGTTTHRLNPRFYGNSDRYNAEATINKHIGGRITPKDAELIRAYIAEKQSVDHISEARSRKIAVHLVGMRRFISVPYDKMTIDDIIAGIAALKNGHAVRFKRVKGTKDEVMMYDGGPFAPNTLQDYIKILKGFIGWLNDTQRTKRSQIDERRLKKAQKIDGAGRTPYKPEDLFSRDEINAMILAANTIRDKCLISVAYETLARPGEIGRLLWSDLTFQDEYVECRLWDTKVKKYRYPTIVDSRNILATWKNDYNGEAKDDNFVFIEEEGLAMSRTACIRVIERAAEKVIAEAEANIREAIEAGMKPEDAKAKHPLIGLKDKPYWKAYNMRHSSATDMIDSGLRLEDLCEIMWGNPNSAQVSTYVTRSKEKVREATLKLRGLKVESEFEENDNKPHRCPKCREVNPARQKYCGKCGRPLTKAGMDELESAKAQIQESELYRQAVEAAYQRLKVELATGN